jgi:hypothetical protein
MRVLVIPLFPQVVSTKKPDEKKDEGVRYILCYNPTKAIQMQRSVKPPCMRQKNLTCLC